MKTILQERKFTEVHFPDPKSVFLDNQLIFIPPAGNFFVKRGVLIREMRVNFIISEFIVPGLQNKVMLTVNKKRFDLWVSVNAVSTMMGKPWKMIVVQIFAEQGRKCTLGDHKQRKTTFN
jgi:hypothetical protein